MKQKTGLQVLTKQDIEQSQDSLPLTQYVAKQDAGILSDTIILHINHALSDVYAINNLFVDDLGATVFFISTPYNNTYYRSSKYNYLFIQRDGLMFKTSFNGKPVSTHHSTSDFMENIHQAILYALKYIKRVYPDKNIIVLQDGGYTAGISKMFQKKDPFTDLSKLLEMVEQTQGGTRLFKEKAKKTNLTYPILSISRSFIKMRVESHFIAQRILEEVNRTVYKMGYFINFKSVIVGGYGTISRPLAFYLKGLNVKVTVLENNKDIQKLALKEGFKVIDNIQRENIDNTFLYIGCTGNCTFGLDEFVHFLDSQNKYYFLASGSSKQNEFNELIDFLEISKSQNNLYYKRYPHLKELTLIGYRKKADGVNEYTCNYNGISKTLYILAEGYPINLYYNEIQSVPDRAIDPIQALLVTSVIKLRQNYHKIENGLHHISERTIIKALKFNEKEMLSKWFYLNDVSANRNNPFKLFKPHPLEKLLMDN